MTYAEYLEAEAASEVRHEFLNGEVWAMAGGSPAHAATAAALIRELGIALRGTPCRVYTSDLRVRILATGLSTYPDVAVVCGEIQTAPEDPDTVVNPVLIVEVLSESTEAYDRGAKAAHYRRIPSLQVYVIASQTDALLEIYRRLDGDRWELVEARRGDRPVLLPPRGSGVPSISASIDVSAVYDGLL
jgi:Uma2 family endonuclease